MKKPGLQRLPVLMHHLISDDTSHISVRPAIFEEQCRMLAENGWFGIGLDEAEEFLINGAPLPEKSFLLTFDDGYLDNYVHAWPIMRKYGHKGVIFAVADRISETQRECATNGVTVRPTLADVWSGTCAREDLPKLDGLLHVDAAGHTVRRDLFFTWDEARLMEQSGTVAIAGHSLRHESVFTGPEFSGFTRPGDNLRTFSQTTPPSFWGLPRFAGGAELASRAFMLSPALIEAIKRLVPQESDAASAFFQSPEKAEALAALVEEHKDALGTLESPEETRLRLRALMEKNQEVLRRELGHAVRSFCWPWGNFCEEARKAGLAAGFSVFYTTSLGMNPPGSPLAVHRFKVKNRKDAWLLRRIRLYSQPLLGALYLKLRL